MTYPFICIEGIDGTGKTTISRLIAEKFNFKYYKTPGGPFYDILKNTPSVLDLPPSARFHFFLSGIYYDSIAIGSILRNNGVVCDRYIYSTITYHTVMGAEIPFSIHDIQINQPTHSFLLLADEHVRRRRVEDRKNNSHWDYKFDLHKKAESLLLDLSLIPIDTTKLSISEVVENILEKIN
jgi:dTMP kinase